ncbi:uncharacterized protein LOC133202544 [Saccostrea echinata]|uniref:uncharacterized protein LOC133202544 n=1 Tax=Saccostrea echinata TaxID=191078 RepID=UPI002A7F80CC|nr:uncharacterized protein LOC133202544 [Saccostrea echinata]
MVFTYDSFLLPISNAMNAVKMVVQNGTVHQLQVDNYFIYRGEIKDGECPFIQNGTTRTCLEECQMDINCTGSDKCCYNGCGHTCQKPVEDHKTSPCDDMEYLLEVGGKCAPLYKTNLTTARDNQTFCSVLGEFIKCSMEIVTKEKGVQCTLNQISAAMRNLGSRMKADLNLTYNPADCYKDIEKIMVKRVAFSVRLRSLNWSESLSDSESPYFQEWNRSIISNISAASENHPAILGITVVRFRKGSVYVDIEIKLDTSKLSLADLKTSVFEETKKGRIHILEVDNYFLFRGELKDGECPAVARNATGICAEECQMDSNCTGTQKCCFNGCGHTCQDTVENYKTSPCDDMEYLLEVGGKCAPLYKTNLTTARDNQTFCSVLGEFIKCSMEIVTKEKGVQCTLNQISAAMRNLGSRMKADLNLTYNPADCYKDIEKIMVKRVAFSVRLRSLNWSESLSDSESPYFQEWNRSIISNISAASENHPAILGITVVRFRKGSVYVDIEIKLDTSKLSLADLKTSVFEETKKGRIHILEVDNYFLFRGELKDGECPAVARNATGICAEECQMDSNCTGTQKCCFNGCGHTCQDTVENYKTSPCDDMEYLLEVGGKCAPLYKTNLTTARDNQTFCSVLGEFIKCSMEIVTKEKGVQCTLNQISAAMRNLGSRMKADLNLTYNPADLKRVAFSVRLRSLNWSESLSDSESPYFQEWNRSIISNISAASENHPAILGITVVRFRKGSVYVDIEIKLDTSKLSLADLKTSVFEETKKGRIHILEVDNYFLFRGELKDGECPAVARNATGICAEECQMDSNCTGTQKCCFNGCGHTCQDTVENYKTSPCDDMEYLLEVGGKCAPLYKTNLTTARDNQTFCSVLGEFIKCSMEIVTKEKGVQCTLNQISAAMRNLGSRMKADLNLTYNPADLKRVAFSVRLRSLNWSESLSDSESPYFQEWNRSIISNISAASENHPAILGITVVRFRKGSVYVDIEIKLDTSKLSLADLKTSVFEETKKGRIHILEVDNYFLFRGELKDGECPAVARNATGICAEECQMDSNCTGTQKCCFNGCGHTCQDTVENYKTSPCDDMEYLLEVGGKCAPLYKTNLTTARDNQTFCSVLGEFIKCSMEIVTKEKGVQCTLNQISAAMRNLGSRMKADLNLTYNPADCYKDIGKIMVKRVAFSVRLRSLNWSESLSDSESPYFQEWNRSIISNISAASENHPAILGITVVRFRKGSVYVDIEIKLDTSKLSLADLKTSVFEETKKGRIHILEVDNYFLFRGELKDGECPAVARNATGICAEECQMDSNCTGTQKCCFNGCGHTCQDTVENYKTSPCDDMEYLLEVGGKCAPLYKTNLTTARDNQTFCSVLGEFIKCSMEIVTKEKGVQCTLNQISAAMRNLGSRMKADLNLTYNPADCYKDIGKIMVKRVAFSVRLRSLNWSESLSDSESPYFQEWNRSIISNISAASENHPAILGITVVRFRKGSVYVDIEIKLDTSKLSLADLEASVFEETKKGRIHILEVDNYFLFRGEMKDGECPAVARNATGICAEECQMDSNCTGTQKCCFNGCGHTCQDTEAKVNACDNITYVKEASDKCLTEHQANLTTSDFHAFCSAMQEFTECSMDFITKESGVRCTPDQTNTAVKTLGPELKQYLNITNNPEDCFIDLQTKKEMTTTIRQ